MAYIDNFLITLFSKEVGKDQFGNRYFQSNNYDYLGRAKRQVVYKGQTEASKVPPMWHAWLHYMTENIPEDKHKFDWQQSYLPNLTFTKLPDLLITHDKSKDTYISWKPLIK